GGVGARVRGEGSPGRPRLRVLESRQASDRAELRDSARTRLGRLARSEPALHSYRGPSNPRGGAAPVFRLGWSVHPLRREACAAALDSAPGCGVCAAAPQTRTSPPPPLP